MRKRKPKVAKKPRRLTMACMDWTPKYNGLDKRWEVEAKPWGGQPTGWLDARACREFADFFTRVAAFAEANRHA